MRKMLVVYSLRNNPDSIWEYRISNIQSLKLKLIFPLMGRVKLKGRLLNAKGNQTAMIDIYLIEKSIVTIMTKKL